MERGRFLKVVKHPMIHLGVGVVLAIGGLASCAATLDSRDNGTNRLPPATSSQGRIDVSAGNQKEDSGSPTVPALIALAGGATALLSLMRMIEEQKPQYGEIRVDHTTE